MCSTSLLFVFRARAVFLGSRKATVSFLLLWMVVAGSCVAQPLFTTAAIHPVPGEGCKVERMEYACITCFVAAAANDVIVFALISWKILTFFAFDEGIKPRFAYFWRRGGLPKVSKILLRTGQQYFL